jgi:hypothetical protein
LTVGLITFSRISASGFAISADAVATTAILEVVTTVPAAGRPATICSGRGTGSVI